MPPDELSTVMHPIELAATVHHRFMHVFPFSKFSGMIGRLMINFVVMKVYVFHGRKGLSHRLSVAFGQRRKRGERVIASVK